MPAEFTLLQQGKGSNASPFLPGGPVALQSCHHKTCRHSSERRKMTWPLTLWRLHLEDTSLPPPCLYLEVCSASHSLPWHIDVCAHTHTRSPQRLLTDKNYRLFNFTDSISDLRQLTDSLLRVGCWQATHALFTNQQGFAKHIMHVIWITLKSILNGLKSCIIYSVYKYMAI